MLAGLGWTGWYRSLTKSSDANTEWTRLDFGRSGQTALDSVREDVT